MASNVPTDEIAIELPHISGDGKSDDDIEHEVNYIENLKKSTDKKRRFVIVTAGKSGVGKSTLINNFLQLEGDAAFEARSGPSSVTTNVNYSDREINGIQVRVTDMPGLHAADSGDRTDEITDILGDLKGVTGEGVDVVFYCINIINRLENIDFENLATLSRVFGSKIWKHVIFVFTYTDVALHNGNCIQQMIEMFIKELHQQLVVKRKVNVEIKSIYSFPTQKLSEEAEINTFNGIVGIPVSNKPSIPPEWRITLLLQVIRKCRRENIPALLKLSCIDWGEVKKSTAIVVASGVGGAVVGTAAGAGIGAVIGGALTAPIGGIGAIPTAAGGAAVGAWIGTLCGGGSIGVGSLAFRIGVVISFRYKIEKRARLKTKGMLEREKKLAQKASSASQDQN